MVRPQRTELRDESRMPRMKAGSPDNKAIDDFGGRNAVRTPILRIGAVVAALAVPTLLAVRAQPPAREPREYSLPVTASAFNSMPAQTDANPMLTAWGDTLAPGMRAIAVSRDLIALGLDHGTVVRIGGLEGEYVVRDKMAARWERKIDIYMGTDIGAAREWGKREVTIYWEEELAASTDDDI
jgi:3D (Asp-Asp-Asp) domain-containing protein